MNTTSVRITQDSVHVAGHDLSHVVHGVTVRIEPRYLPEVTLDLLPAAVEFDVDAARVVVDDETREVLVRLGWTPPAGEVSA